MRAQNLKFIKQIKEVLQFLNKNFPSKDYPKFRAFLPPEDAVGDFQSWHIVTDDWFLYMGKGADAEEYRLCLEAIRTKFKFKIVFCYLYYVSGNIKFKTGKYILVK